MSRSITPIEYAKEFKVSHSGVTKAIRQNRALKGVKQVKKHGRFYLLILENNFGSFKTTD